MSILHIALIQIEGSPIPEENIATAQMLADEATRRGAELLIFPEMFMALPQKNSSLIAVAEPLTGHFVTSLKEIAREQSLTIVAGVWETIPGSERVYNTAVMISPEGKILTAYRKLHLFDALNVRESDKMLPGDDLPEIVNVKGFHVSLALCYDLRFPELFRHLALQGTELFIVPSGWYAGLLKEEHWLTLLRARAIENTCYIAGVNLTGSLFCGRSAVFDPFGVCKADAGEGFELILVPIQSERIVEVRSKLPTLRHCRSFR